MVAEKFGSLEKTVGPVTLMCITEDARDLLDKIMTAWKLHYAGLKESHGADYEPGFYGFAYWLCRWSELVAPADALEAARQKVERLTNKLDARKAAELGEGPCAYEPMPEKREHECHHVNTSGVPVDWIEISDKYGPQIMGTDCYGGGSYAEINYCPWCGVLLRRPA